MKQIAILGIVLLLTFGLLGCACYPPGYGCGVNPIGCAMPANVGVIDYVDGYPGAGEANCGENYAVGCGTGNVAGSCNPCAAHGTTNCGSCLANVGSGIRVLGEGALSLAAAPFVLAGNIISGGGCGYETFSSCGCSNEVYYCDHCYQEHDFCDPCQSGYAGCGADCGPSVATSGCTSCNNGYVEGVQPMGVSGENLPTPTATPSAQLVQPKTLQVNQQAGGAPMIVQRQGVVRQRQPIRQVSQVQVQNRPVNAQPLPPQPQRLVPPQRIIVGDNQTQGIPLR